MQVLITNQGLYYEAWGDSIKDKIVTPLEKGIHHYYSATALFSDDLTVEGLLNSLYKYKEIIEHDFVSYFNGINNLQPYYDQLALEPNEKEKIYTSLVVKHTCSVHVHKNLLKDRQYNYVNAWNNIVGCNKTVADPTFSISFEKLNNIKHLPISLDFMYNLWCMDPLSGDKLLGSNLIHHFTLHEILVSLVNEMTFFGSPQDVEMLDEMIDEEWDKLKTVDELIEKSLDIPTEQLLIEDLKQQLKFALEEQEYEACRRIQNEIDRHEAMIKK
jgi:hypothetical protein